MGLPLIKVSPCFAANSTKVESWTISGPGGPLRTALTETGAMAAFRDVVADYLARGIEVGFQAVGPDGAVETGYYDKKGEKHLTKAPTSAKAGKKASSAPAPAKSASRPASKPRVSARGGRGMAHPGLQRGAGLYQTFVHTATDAGVSFEAARKAWASRKDKLKAATYQEVVEAARSIKGKVAHAAKVVEAGAEKVAKAAKAISAKPAAQAKTKAQVVAKAKRATSKAAKAQTAARGKEHAKAAEAAKAKSAAPAKKSAKGKAKTAAKTAAKPAAKTAAKAKTSSKPKQKVSPGAVKLPPMPA